jgi:hypothetical protein
MGLLQPNAVAADAPRRPAREGAARPQGRDAPSLKQPFCTDCAEAEFNRLEVRNDDLPAEQREPRETLRMRARLAARMVGFFGEWVCPRCTLIDIGAPLVPEPVPFGALFPNRSVRRAFERWSLADVNGRAGEEVQR